MNKQKKRIASTLNIAWLIVTIALSGHANALTHQQLPIKSNKPQIADSVAAVVNEYVAAPQTEKLAAFFGVTAIDFERNLLIPELTGMECEVVVVN